MARRLDRRSLLAGGAALALGACTKKAPPSTTSSSAAPGALPPGGAWRKTTFDAEPDIPQGQLAQILDPWAAHGGPKPERRPVLVALHGRGEAGRGLDVGADAWPKDYELERMNRRLFAPPLLEADLHHMTNKDCLGKLNASLAKSPYRGIAVACPYTPHLDDQTPEGSRAFGRFVVGELLHRLRDLTGLRAHRDATGIDGVSMGGRLALFVGLMNPEVFGVVGALQPALKEEEAPLVSALARMAMAKQKVKLRLVTSDDDVFLGAVVATSTRLRADGVDHELLIVPGSHGYEFNRGPGGAEMLLWHERVQRGLPSPGVEPPPGPTDEDEPPPPRPRRGL